jgi:hypothetical protein
MDRDRVCERDREIHEHEHVNTHTNLSEAIERNKAGEPFSTACCKTCHHLLLRLSPRFDR